MDRGARAGEGRHAVSSRPVPAPFTDEPCAHHIKRELGYLQWHADANRRAKRGESQTQCRTCGRWLWADEWGDPPAESGAPR